MFGTFLFYMISKGPLGLQILLVILVHRLTHHCHYGFPEDVNGDVYVNEVYDKLHAKKVLKNMNMTILFKSADNA